MLTFTFQGESTPTILLTEKPSRDCNDHLLTRYTLLTRPPFAKNYDARSFIAPSSFRASSAEEVQGLCKTSRSHSLLETG